MDYSKITILAAKNTPLTGKALGQWVGIHFAFGLLTGALFFVPLAVAV